MTTSQKRINIILFYILLIAAFAGVIYFMTRPEMTCTDGVKNQGEENVDCGGPCQACKTEIKKEKLVVKSVETVENDKGGQDVLIKIYNPNEKYGAKMFEYEIYNGEENQNTHNYKGRNFILPKETKHIIVNGYVPQNNAGRIFVKLTDNIKWEKITKLKNPNLVIYNDKYNMQKTGNKYTTITGIVVNKSMADYRSVKVKGILRDVKGKLMGISYQTLDMLPSGGKRAFQIIFSMKFPNEVSTKEVEVETNIFDPDNYLKVKGQQDQWDQ